MVFYGRHTRFHAALGFDEGGNLLLSTSAQGRDDAGESDVGSITDV